MWCVISVNHSDQCQGFSNGIESEKVGLSWIDLSMPEFVLNNEITDSSRVEEGTPLWNTYINGEFSIALGRLQ